MSKSLECHFCGCAEDRDGAGHHSAECVDTDRGTKPNPFKIAKKERCCGNCEHGHEQHATHRFDDIECHFMPPKVIHCAGYDFKDDVGPRHSPAHTESVWPKVSKATVCGQWAERK